MEDKKRKIKLFYTCFAIFGALVFFGGIAAIIVAAVGEIKPAILFVGVLLLFLGFAFTDLSIRHIGKLKKGNKIELTIPQNINEDKSSSDNKKDTIIVEENNNNNNEEVKND